MSVTKPAPQQPGLLWRSASTFIMATTGMLCRAFLYGLNDVEVVGLDKFLALLDSRKDVEARQRGLITVSNHISVMDDPIMWGVLPLRYAADHRNLRWGLGSHDICYANTFTGHFFCAGQTLPTHRLRHSPWGGLFQPTMNQAVKLLCAPPLPARAEKLGAPLTPLSSSSSSFASSSSPPPSSPFSTAPSTPPTTPPPSSDPPPRPVFASSFPRELYYSTDDSGDRWPAPAAYPSNRHAWVHIFPEGCVHQDSRQRGLRYFKWGVARLLLEAEPAPDVVPMFVDGLDRVMPEDRGFPRFLPRIGRRVRVVFGEALDRDAFADLRARWRGLVDRSRRGSPRLTQAGSDSARTAADAEESTHSGANSGVEPLDLKYGPEAQQLRIEAAARIRDEILKLRARAGYPEPEDPARALAETWADETDSDRKRYRSRVDDSMVYRE